MVIVVPHRRLAAFAFALGLTAIGFAGDLTPPPGPVSPTMLPLTQVEPRTPISASTTPGDADSLFRITQPGSYFLTGDVVGVAGRSGIEIAASDVTIDLMGFTLRGVAGSLGGIVEASLFLRVAIRNGFVRGWGEAGVDLINSGSIVDGLTLVSNGREGLRVGSSSVLRSCVAEFNGLAGIVAGTSSTIQDCISSSNGAQGYLVNSRSTVSRCAAEGNQGAGFEGVFGALFVDCAAGSNAESGFDVRQGVTVNRCSSTTNGAHGILASNDCVILFNMCHRNGTLGEGSGVHVTSTDVRVEGNICTDNDWGIRTTASGGIYLRNSCSGNTSGNWNIVAGNVCLVIAATPTTTSFTGNSGGVSPGTSDPNANFSY